MAMAIEKQRRLAPMRSDTHKKVREAALELHDMLQDIPPNIVKIGYEFMANGRNMHEAVRIIYPNVPEKDTTSQATRLLNDVRLRYMVDSVESKMATDLMYSAMVTKDWLIAQYRDLYWKSEGIEDMKERLKVQSDVLDKQAKLVGIYQEQAPINLNIGQLAGVLGKEAQVGKDIMEGEIVQGGKGDSPLDE